MPSPLADDITTAIKRSVNIVELIGEHVTLTRRGRVFKGLCPFHDDHNPSLNVDPDRQYYKCFSCGAGGDIFDFVMSRERLNFREALEALAGKARIQLPARRGRPAGESRKDELLAVLRWAEDEFHRCLIEADVALSAREYTAKRGFSPESVEAFRLGFAPKGGDWLLQRARSRRFTPEQLQKCGLAGQRQDGSGHYDWFRGRLMFPIRDARGQTIAFGGRILPEFDGPNTGKYVNSPETAIFSKSENLYGLDRARDAIAKAKCAAVVEGYTDCIMAHQHGLAHVVAPLGTALGDRQVGLLKRYAERVVLVYDGDDAGQKAADRNLAFFLSQEVELRVLTLADGLDPCDFLLQRGADAFRAGLDSAVDALDFKVERASRLFEFGSVNGRRQALDFVLSAIAAFPVLTTGAAPVTREIVLDRLGQRLGIAQDVVRRRLRELREQQTRRNSNRGSGEPASASATSPWTNEAPEDRELLETLLSDPSQIGQIAAQVAVDEIQTPGLRRIFEVCLEMNREGQVPDLDGIRLRLEDRELACRASSLAEEGREKGAVDRRIADVLDVFRRRRSTAETTEIRRSWSAARGNDDAQKGLIARQSELALARQRKKERHAKL